MCFDLHSLPLFHFSYCSFFTEMSSLSVWPFLFPFRRVASGNFSQEIRFPPLLEILVQVSVSLGCSFDGDWPIFGWQSQAEKLVFGSSSGDSPWNNLFQLDSFWQSIHSKVSDHCLRVGCVRCWLWSYGSAPFLGCDHGCSIPVSTASACL